MIKYLLILINIVQIAAMYQYRGFMLDTSRKFFPVNSIFKILDYMHEANLNVFHWSLSNNEAFRVKCKFDLGLLTQNINYYTIQDINKIVNYAKNIGIEVVPEFDFPGHVKCWGNVYSNLMVDWTNDEFDVSNPSVYILLTALFKEIIPLFSSSKYIHMGHDETSNSNTEIMKSLSFAKSISNMYGKTPIIWNDPITSKNIRINNFIIQTWNNMESLNTVLSLNYKTIISVSDYWYIGGKFSPNQFVFPNNPNIIGAELCWFTSESDDPTDLLWIKDIIIEAGKKLN